MPKLKEILEKENAPRETPRARRSVRLVKMGGKISLLERALFDSAPDHLRSSLSSMLGLMRRHSSHRLRLDLTWSLLKPFLRYGRFDEGLTRFIPEAERSFFNRLISTSRRWSLRPVL